MESTEQTSAGQPAFPRDERRAAYEELAREHPPLYRDPFAMPFPPAAPMKRKSKLAAGLLSFFIPGTGHFYLGAMRRGLFMMLLIIIDIFLITATAGTGGLVPLVVLFGLFMPVIYFYTLFDSLQQADRINEGGIQIPREQSDPFSPRQSWLVRLTSGGNAGLLLVVAGMLIFLFSAKPRWFIDLMHNAGSYVGGIVLVGVGVVMFVLESRKQQ